MLHILCSFYCIGNINDLLVKTKAKVIQTVYTLLATETLVDLPLSQMAQVILF